MTIQFIGFIINMQATQIRDKYKKILEQPESENSDDEWEIAYSQMAKQRKKRILTESSPNRSYAENNDGQQNLLNLKQKLAQCLSNCKDHSKQIQRMKKQQLIFEEDKIEWQQAIIELKRNLEEERETNKIYVQKKSLLQAQIVSLNTRVQELSMDRELQLKQCEYYKGQLSQLKCEYEKRQKEYRHYDKQFKQLDRIKKQNDYLKNDVERLSSIIQDSLRFGKVSSQLMKKHFLGKPYKEMENWYPQHLVGEVQVFLKKNQIGYGNKQFTANLIKFIDKISEKIGRQSQLRIKNIHSSSKAKQNSSIKKPSRIILENSTYKKHSYNLNSLRQEVLKSNTNCFWKATESRLVSDSQNCKQIVIKTICWEIITEFKSIVFQLLLEKEVKRKKIKKLIDSMCNGVMEAFQSPLLDQDKDKKDPFATIKLQVEDITAPMKGTK